VIDRILERLRDYWGPLANPHGATEAEIVGFEKRYEAVLPADFLALSPTDRIRITASVSGR
jgi:hypothetical protein